MPSIGEGHSAPRAALSRAITPTEPAAAYRNHRRRRNLVPASKEQLVDGENLSRGAPGPPSELIGPVTNPHERPPVSQKSHCSAASFARLEYHFRSSRGAVDPVQEGIRYV